jgi:hypothetical protein
VRIDCVVSRILGDVFHDMLSLCRAPEYQVLA